MAKPNFFNENLNRSYPFRVGTVDIEKAVAGSVTLANLPDKFIVDCGFILGPLSQFSEQLNQVYLSKVSRPDSSTILFEFACDAAGISKPLVFTRHDTDPNFTSEFVESSQDSVSESTDLCSEPEWSGYLVTGDTAALFSMINTGQTIERQVAEAVIEPTLIQNLANNQVVSISLANADRTRAIRPENCPALEWNFVPGQIFVQTACLQGNLAFRPGYNCTISQLRQTNEIQLQAIELAGAGSPCDQVAIFPTETPPTNTDNDVLEGDRYCNEVLRTINGIQGPNVNVYAGTGVSIVSAENELTIDINFRDLSLCDYSTVSESL